MNWSPGSENKSQITQEHTPIEGEQYKTNSTGEQYKTKGEDLKHRETQEDKDIQNAVKS